MFGDMLRPCFLKVVDSGGKEFTLAERAERWLLASSTSMSTPSSLFPDAKVGPERADVIETSSVIDATLETSTASSPGPSTSALSSPQDHVQSMTVEEEDAHLVTDKLLTFRFVWSGKTLEFEISESDCVEDLKSTLQRLTNVPMERQKILGLTKGRMPSDGTKLSDLQPTVGKKFTLIGTPAGAELKDPDELPDLPDVLNDLEPDLDPAAQRAMVQDHRNIRKVREMTKKLQLNIMNPPRPGKRLLVLDIDYTILDTKPMTSGSLPAGQCARPGLHEFLTAVYEHYDIAIWSQTSWNWLEVKLVELGMIGGDQPYKISFVLDKTIMFQVYSMREGKEFKHAVKALKIIWNLIPQYNATNTIHIDDLSRNFVLNPRNGIKISAYKDCTSAKARQDEELYLCNVYLRFLAGVPDFQQVDHQKWRSVATSLKSLARRL